MGGSSWINERVGNYATLHQACVNLFSSTLKSRKEGYTFLSSVVYYESMKRKLEARPLYECWYDERLKTKGEECIHLTYSVLLGELEHLKMKTRLIGEMFASVMGEYVLLK